MRPVAIVVHGGAWEIPDEIVAGQLEGIGHALRAGYDALRSGATAVEAAIVSVQALEDDPRFDSGTGAFLNRDGQPELDAAVMDGTTLASGAVGSVVGVRNPVRLARLVLEAAADRLLVGAGAVAFARSNSVEIVDPDAMTTAAAHRFWESHRLDDPRAIFDRHPTGTVGAVALDAHGAIAVATSTGGLPGKHPGRVGDTPLIGCGFYADSSAAGAAATGHGEAIMTVGLTRFVVESVRGGTPVGHAVEMGIKCLEDDRIAGRGGVVALDASGCVGVAFNTGRMARGWIDAAGASWCGVDPA